MIKFNNLKVFIIVFKQVWLKTIANDSKREISLGLNFLD